SLTSGRRLPAVLGLVLLAPIDPHLDADLSVGRVRLGEAEVDVRLQRVERETALLVPLGARDLGAVQAGGAAGPDPLRAEAERRLDALLHGAAERDAPLELERDRLGHQLRVGLGPLDLDDVDVDLGVRSLLELVAQLVDLGPALADDDSRPRGLDVDLEL